MIAVLLVPGIARANNDEMIPCHPASADTRLAVMFQPEVPVTDLVVWIIAPKAMTPKQGVELFVDALEAAGLAVVQKRDTFLIKPGPGMPRSMTLTSSLPPRDR